MLTISLPWPDSALSPNSRNRYKKMAAVTIARSVAWGCAMEARPAYISIMPLVVMMEFYPPDKIHRDLDNLIAMEKASVDGIMDAIGINDHAIVRLIGERRGVYPGGKVVITIDKLEAK